MFCRHNPVVQNPVNLIPPVFISFYAVNEIITDFIGTNDQTMAQIKSLAAKMAQNQANRQAFQYHKRDIGYKEYHQLTAGEIHNFEEE